MESFYLSGHIKYGSTSSPPSATHPTSPESIRTAIYIITLVTRWIQEVGVDALYKQNVAKAKKLYDAIDGSDFFRGTALPGCRSDMNVTFRLPDEELEALFVKEAAGQDLKGLKGHRSVGGLRASIYNAFPVEGVDVLVSFMKEFERTRG